MANRPVAAHATGASPRATLQGVPAGIEFECPHCQRVTKVPVTLAGKQGRCAGCRRVLEVPVGTATTGTPDPDEGLLEVLDAKRASERLPAKKPSERVVPKKPSMRVENLDAAKRPSNRVGAANSPPPLLDDSAAAAKADDDGGGTTSLHIITPSKPGPLPFSLWVRRVPFKVWLGVLLSLPLPALGVALCVLGLRPARTRNAGERVAWTGIVIGSSIMLMNLVVVAMRRLSDD